MVTRASAQQVPVLRHAQVPLKVKPSSQHSQSSLACYFYVRAWCTASTARQFAAGNQSWWDTSGWHVSGGHSLRHLRQCSAHLTVQSNCNCNSQLICSLTVSLNYTCPTMFLCTQQACVLSPNSMATCTAVSVQSVATCIRLCMGQHIKTFCKLTCCIPDSTRLHSLVPKLCNLCMHTNNYEPDAACDMPSNQSMVFCADPTHCKAHMTLGIIHPGNSRQSAAAQFVFVAPGISCS